MWLCGRRVFLDVLLMSNKCGFVYSLLNRDIKMKKIRFYLEEVDNLVRREMC